MSPSVHTSMYHDISDSISPTNTRYHVSSIASTHGFVENQSPNLFISQNSTSNSSAETLAENLDASDKDHGPESTSLEDEPALLEAKRHPTLADDSGSDTAAERDNSQNQLRRTQSKLQSVHVTGPSSFFNPTNVRMHVRFRRQQKSDDPQPCQTSNDEFLFHWRSRDQRKGRNSSIVSLKTPRLALLSRIASLINEVVTGILVMITTFPYWNMAFWSGWSYTIGSILFVIDGAWSWGPVAFPSTEWSGEEEYGVPLCFFFGALFYQLGATVAYLEAINDGSFAGSAMKRLLEGHEADQKKLLDEKLHGFFGHLRPHRRSSGEKEDYVDPEAGWENVNTTFDPVPAPSDIIGPAARRGGIDHGRPEEGQMTEYLVWRWWPTWKAFRTRHIYDIGYVACTIQLVGATLYGVCGVVILPGLLSSLNTTQTLFAYWIPQIVASVCFLTAGIMFTLETQDKWHKPLPKLLGWWIGAWATIGSMGFLLCAIFGIPSDTYHWCEYQSDLSSMWGSAAYLISSLLQWYEAVNKGPVLAFPNL